VLFRSAYYERGQSLITYNHRDRTPEEEYVKRFQRIRDYIDDIGDMIFIRFNRYSVRDYVFVLQPEHAGIVKERMNAMVNGPWSKCLYIYNID
jgi:hypothetical protein